MRETRVYDATTGEAAGPKLDPGGIVVDAAFSPDGAQVAIAALTSQTPEERTDGSSWPMGKRATCRSGTGGMGGGSSGPCRCRRNRAGWPSGPMAEPWPWSAPITAWCSSIPATGPCFTTWTRESGRSPSTPTCGRSNGEARFSPDGRFLLTWERVPILHVWDPDSGRLLHTLKHNERVEYAAFNPAAPCRGHRRARQHHPPLGPRQGQAARPAPATAMGRVARILPRRFRDDQRLLGRFDSFVGLADRPLSRGLPHNPAVLQLRLHGDRRTLVVQGSSSLEVTHWPSGTPLGPAWGLRDSIHWGVAIPAGDRRAIVGGFSGTITGFDLEKMVTPTTASVDEMTRLAELAAGRRIMSEGSVVPISSTEWAERWEQLRHTQDDPSRTPAAAPATDRAGP